MWKYGQQRVKREAEEAMLDAELATMYGYANVTVKGHAAKRRREWLNQGRRTTQSSGQANVAGWAELTRLFSQGGSLGTVQHGGEPFVQ